MHIDRLHRKMPFSQQAHYKQFFFEMFEHEMDYDPTRKGFFENALICPWNFLMQKLDYKQGMNQIHKG